MCVCGVGGGGLVGGAGDLPDRRVLSSEKQMQEVSGGYEKTWDCPRCFLKTAADISLTQDAMHPTEEGSVLDPISKTRK